AAGWLASQGAWVHPSDLALRAAGLTGQFDTALLTGRTAAMMPNTQARQARWAAPDDLAAAATGERAVSRALALARLLQALPRRYDPLASAETAAAALGPLGAGAMDPGRFRAWRGESLAAARAEAGAELPPLLRAAAAAQGWMEAGVVDEPDALQALGLAALRLARSGTLRTVPLPFWVAWPTLGRDGSLPRLRPAAARRIAATDAAAWTVTFLAFAAEAARAGLRELDRLRTVLAAGEKLAAGRNQGARLGDAVRLAVAAPVVTGRGLATSLGITLQTANRLLAVLTAGGMVREVTGRGSFRGFAA
ncbi:MAG: hypothetical protein JO227_20560, partial [Acetobacteraceae bacterium]|nr:hypothetical protein [Acetobacteraceae bacterium]